MAIFAKIIDDKPKKAEMPPPKFVKIEEDNDMSLKEISHKLEDRSHGRWLDDIDDDTKKAMMKYTMKLSKYNGYLSEEINETAFEGRNDPQAVIETLGFMLIYMVRTAQCFDKDLSDIVESALQDA